MERFPQAYLPGGAWTISLSKSVSSVSSEPAFSAQTPTVLCQLLIGSSSQWVTPHSVCGGVPHPGYDASAWYTSINIKVLLYNWMLFCIRCKDFIVWVVFLICIFALILGGHGPLHFGTCTSWLNTIKKGHTVPCFIHRYWKWLLCVF